MLMFKFGSVQGQKTSLVRGKSKYSSWVRSAAIYLNTSSEAITLKRHGKGPLLAAWDILKPPFPQQTKTA